VEGVARGPSHPQTEAHHNTRPTELIGIIFRGKPIPGFIRASQNKSGKTIVGLKLQLALAKALITTIRHSAQTLLLNGYEHSLKSPACSCVSITFPAAS
jgi:hypothetical protein